MFYLLIFRSMNLSSKLIATLYNRKKKDTTTTFYSEISFFIKKTVLLHSDN